MRKLLLFFAMFCVSIGAWATPTVSTSTWMQNNSAYETQTVAEIYLQNAGELAEALTMVSGDFQYLHLSTNTGVGLSAEDIAALNALDVKTIEMNHVSGPYFEFDNPNVEYITLPYNWTKEQVKAVGETHKTHPNFKACISTSDTEGSGEATLIAYLNEAGKMRDAILHSYFDTRDYKTLGSGNGDCSRVCTLVAMGNVCAKDISRAGNYDANGHYVINGVADENNSSKNKNTEGGDLYTTAETAGAIVGCYGIKVIDLSQAIIPDEYCADIVPGYAFVTTDLREFWIPEDPNFKTLPADFMNCSAAIHQICIPGNIETIRTRAFAGTNINYIWTTGPDATVRYDNGATFITNAGEENEVRTQRYKTQVGENYTATENFDPTVEYPVFQDGDDNSFNYGTITLPAGLRLIERFAFYSSTSVSDLYILNPVAPECHVDGFNSSMYHANNTVKSENIREEEDEDGNKIKIITREAYNNGINQPMAMLHYPQDTTDPNIQRYTDPSRQYSIATGDRDGKGNMLYFPTQTEFEVAEWEGTHGYLWNAWNIDRTWYNQEVMLGTGGGWYGNAFGSTGGYTAAGQELANSYYTANPDTITSRYNPNGKIDRSFYDVTNNGTYSQPEGLQPYYNTVYAGHQLYPQAKSETSNYVYVRDDNGDYVKDPTSASTTVFRAYAGSADDQLARYSRKQDIGYYSCPNGEFVQDYSWIKDDAGLYILDGEYTPNTTGGGAYVQDYTWVRDDANGTHYHPLVSTAFPGDQWGNLPNDFNAYADYWYATFSYNLDPNGEGEYVKAHDNNYYTQETLPSYWANDYQTFKNNGTYNRTLLGYAQCANNEDVKNHKYDLFVVGDTYALWTSDVKDFVNGQKFARNPIAGEYREYNPSTDEGCDRYDITGNGFVLAVSPADDSKQHYTKSYVANSYREFDSSRDKSDEPLYCYGESDFVSDTPITYTVQNDYRGWHQFVLAGYGYNGVVPNEPIRSFISDNDWWTICEPYDLKYSELIDFFGTNNGIGEVKKPYLSKLMYVIRDVEKGKITLMFSKNLMEYKEAIASDDQVHGTIDDETTWIGNGEGQYADEAALRAANPVILHKGVPYLIKPNLLEDGNGNIIGSRQFNIYKSNEPELYARLNAAATQGAGAQASMIYDGVYTVPAYVVGLGKEGAGTEAVESSGTKTITNKDGSSFTYKDSEKGGKLVYGGKEVDYKISAAYTYSFVGSLYNSLMPQYCYFLGYDSAKKKAVFRYSAVQDKSGWNWNNETGIICPNFNTATKIHSATGFNDPARWTIADANGTMLAPDDITMATGAAKSYTFDFGATNYFEMEEATGVSEMVVKPLYEETKVYDANGIYRGSSLQNLPKGVYVVNGKKYVVK